MGKLVNDMGGAAMLANVILGENSACTGRWPIANPSPPETLAAKTGNTPPCWREWLSAHAASGYMNTATASSAFRRSKPQALAIEDSQGLQSPGEHRRGRGRFPRTRTSWSTPCAATAPCPRASITRACSAAPNVSFRPGCNT